MLLESPSLLLENKSPASSCEDFPDALLDDLWGQALPSSFGNFADALFVAFLWQWQ